MQLSPSVRLKQKQSLVMTPQLQQAIRLLQMTNIELKDYLEEQALENPFIDVSAGADSAAPSTSDNAQPGDASPAASSDTPQDTPQDTLQDTPAALDGMNASQALSDDPTQHNDFENRFSSDELQLGGPASAGGAATDWDMIATIIPNREDSLNRHVMGQIDFAITESRDRFIAVALLDGLAPSGWLDASIDSIAESCQCTTEQVESVLKRMQKFEPTGIFARSLAECLSLQAHEADCLDNVMQTVLDNIDQLAAGEIKALARKAKADEDDIIACLHRIRSFNPKPAEGFSHTMVGNHSPDVILRKTASGWSIDLNRSTLPTPEIKEDFAKSVGDRARGSQKDTTKEYVQQSMGSAKWLKRTLEQRNTTTLKIAAELVRRQQSFFRNGLEGLQPMALRDVAEAIGMHESTISRVTSGLLIATPKGTLPMKSFFSVSIAATDDGEAKAAAAVRGMVKEIISKEDPGRPMSDELIARLISKKGIRLARRTVAKYREILRIPSSSERRRRGKLALSS